MAWSKSRIEIRGRYLGSKTLKISKVGKYEQWGYEDVGPTQKFLYSDIFSKEREVDLFISTLRYRNR